MFDYFLTNIAINLIALCMFIILKDSPARLRFYVVVTALFTWFIPWNLIATVPIISESLNPLTDEVFNSLLWLENQQSNDTESTVSSAVQLNSSSIKNIWNILYGSLTSGTLFILISVMGLLLFIKDIINYHGDLKAWNNVSEQDNSLWNKHGFKHQNIAIRILDGCGPGMATGLIKPTVWLNKRYHSSSTAKTILTHELQHIKQNDPSWMWFITFIQRCFWWNPLVRLLTGIAREQIELSCDEKCRQQLKDCYSTDLANILLEGSAVSSPYIAAISIKNGTNFNIERIKKLTKENTMKTKHLLVLVVGFCMVGFVGAAVSSQDANQTKSITKYDPPRNKQGRTIYLKSELHNKLVDELLQITHLAKSNSPDTVSQIIINIHKWNVNREKGPNKRSEHSLKSMSFTMVSYLLDKQGRYDEIPTTYEIIFPNTPVTEQLGLKHHLAVAYIKMGEPEKALRLLADVTERQRQHGPKSGTLLVMAHANLAAGYYDEVIVLADKIATISKQKFGQIRALNYKRAAYMAMSNTEKTNEVNNILEESYLAKGSAPKLVTMGSPILSYLPEV